LIYRESNAVAFGLGFFAPRTTADERFWRKADIGLMCVSNDHVETLCRQKDDDPSKGNKGGNKREFYNFPRPRITVEHVFLSPAQPAG
jgi:hypothetical protein